MQDAIKGEIPEHFDLFRSTMSQQHGYNTRNGYMPIISKPRMGQKQNILSIKQQPLLFLFNYCFWNSLAKPYLEALDHAIHEEEEGE